jgi:DNA-binding Lrp family transcriptional regulator
LAIDSLDKKLLTELCKGVASYQELARTCGVARNTVYRRIAALERQGTIKNTLRCLVNLEKLDINSIIIGVNVAQKDIDRAFGLLASNGNVGFLWRTYGSRNIVAIAVAQKGEEGKVVDEIKMLLECCNLTDLDISIGFEWGKSSYSSLFIENQTLEKTL